MKKHMDTEGIPVLCPHPQCSDALSSDADFWSHAISIHGVPPFGARRTTNKRKATEISNDTLDLDD